MTRRLAISPALVPEIRAYYQRGKRGRGYGATAKRFGLAESTVRDLILYWTGAYL